MREKISRAVSRNTDRQARSKMDQKDQICIVERIQDFLEEVRSQVQAPSRMWDACPWFAKLVGVEKQDPQVKN
jgi:hypothetical protein